MTAIELLASDPQSDVIAFVSKPPAKEIRSKVIDKLKAQGKPVVALFLGTKPEIKQDGNLYFTETLDETARVAAMLGRVEKAAAFQPQAKGKKISGLYAGGHSRLSAQCYWQKIRTANRRSSRSGNDA